MAVTLKSGLLLTCGNYPYLGIQNLPVRLAKYIEVPNLNNYYNKSYIDELEDELRGLINDNKPIELLYSQTNISQTGPEVPVVTFDTAMDYIEVNIHDSRTGEKTGYQQITPGNNYEGRINGSPVIVTFSSDGLIVRARISDIQVQQYRTLFDIKGYGRRQ